MFKNTKKQGDWGLGEAIAYFTKNEYTVSVPLTDSQDYDLIVEKDNKLQRVQIKTNTYKNKKGSFAVSLTTKGGNRSYSTIKKFNKENVELVFIVTSENKKYLIPTDYVLNSIALGPKYDVFLV